MLPTQFTIALILLSVIASGTQAVTAAEFKLASRFLDADSDMVADTPTDPGKQMDPSTLIFAYTPVEDPAVYAKVWDGFLEASGEDDRQEGAVLPGAVERGADRGHARRPAACGRLQHGRNAARRQLRRLHAVHADGACRTAASAMRWRSSPIPGSGIDKVRRPQGQEAGIHGRDIELRLQGPVGDPRDRVRARGGQGLSSPSSPANTTIRSWASPTRTIRLPPSPTR